jgi:hypothetical protein
MSDYSETGPVSARLVFSNEKALKAETPMVIWHVDRLPGLIGHLTEPPLEGGSTSSSGGETTSAPQPEEYMAICDEVQHPSDLPGVTDSGAWLGNVVDNLRDACNAAAAHEDGLAHVTLRLGSHLVAVQCS